MAKKKGDGRGRYKKEYDEVGEHAKSELQKIIAIRLNDLLNKREITQDILADNTGVARGTISNCLNAKYSSEDGSISADGLYRIAKYLDVTTDYLLGLSDVSTPTITMQAISKETGLSENAIIRLINDKKIVDTPIDKKKTEEVFNKMQDWCATGVKKYSEEERDYYIAATFSPHHKNELLAINYLIEKGGDFFHHFYEWLFKKEKNSVLLMGAKFEDVFHNDVKKFTQTQYNEQETAIIKKMQAVSALERIERDYISEQNETEA